MSRIKGAKNYSRYRVYSISANASATEIELYLNAQAKLKYELVQIVQLPLGTKIITKRSWK